MEMTLTTPTYTIAVTDISPDYNNDSCLEVSFLAELSRAYVDSTPFALEADVADTDDYFAGDTHIVFELNVAQRHEHGLYYIIKHDRSGDCYSDYSDAVFAFGQPVIDHIDAVCKLLNVPFYPTR